MGWNKDSNYIEESIECLKVNNMNLQKDRERVLNSKKRDKGATKKKVSNNNKDT